MFSTGGGLTKVVDTNVVSVTFRIYFRRRHWRKQPVDGMNDAIIGSEITTLNQDAIDLDVVPDLVSNDALTILSLPCLPGDKLCQGMRVRKRMVLNDESQSLIVAQQYFGRTIFECVEAIPGSFEAAKTVTFASAAANRS